MPRSRSRRRSRSRSCPKGQILRKAYTRRSRSGSRVRVPATCIKDLGTKGHGEKLWTVKEGLLGKYGYHLHDPASKRHNALRKAVQNESYATVIRQLNAVRNYTHRSYPANSKKYGSDIKWVQNNLGRYSLSRGGSRSRSRKRSRSKSKKRSRSRSKNADYITISTTRPNIENLVKLENKLKGKKGIKYDGRGYAVGKGGDRVDSFYFVSDNLNLILKTAKKYNLKVSKLDRINEKIVKLN